MIILPTYLPKVIYTTRHMSWAGGWGPVPVVLPHISTKGPYTDDTMLPWEDLSLPQDTADFAGTSVGKSIGNGSTENPRLRHQCKVLGVVWLDKTHVVPKAVIFRVQASIGILGFWRTFALHLVLCLHSLYCLVKKGCIWAWR